MTGIATHWDFDKIEETVHKKLTFKEIMTTDLITVHLEYLLIKIEDLKLLTGIS